MCGAVVLLIGQQEVPSELQNEVMESIQSYTHVCTLSGRHMHSMHGRTNV
jgi:hypothetical protein